MHRFGCNGRKQDECDGCFNHFPEGNPDHIDMVAGDPGETGSDAGDYDFEDD